VVENKFKKQIREEVEKKLLSESCREAISEKKIRVRSLADVQDIEVAKDQPMRFTATLVTEPDFDLPDYKNIPVKLKPADVADAEVDETIENLRERQADFIDLTGRPVALDDFAVIDYTGLIDGKPVEEVVPKAGKPLTGNTDFWIKVTQDGFIFKNFCENLVGANVGEARTFDVEVPADFAITETGREEDHLHRHGEVPEAEETA